MAFTVGIVVPVFRHSHLMVEAIESALAQDYVPAPMIVVVNDGCPHRETHFIAEAYTTTHPDRIRYLYKQNGGLSSARNAGIEFLLAQQPEIGAVYLLDADNRLEPYAIGRFVSVLRESGAGWAYPDIDRFGLAGHDGFAGEYRLSVHLGRNVCEAGSLIAADMLRAGLRFDENMQKGFEDWEFWLSAAERGFRGRHVESSGFQYRRRPSSMLSESHVLDEQIRQYIKDKHKRLYEPKAVKALVAQEAPSLAVVDLNDRTVLIGEDPLAPERTVSLAEFRDEVWAAIENPDSSSAPLDIVFSRRDLAAPDIRRILRGAVWQLLNDGEATAFKSLSLRQPQEEGVSLAWLPPHVESPRNAETEADFLAIRISTLIGILTDTNVDWMLGQLNAFEETVSHQVLEVDAYLPRSRSIPLRLQVLNAIIELKDDERAASVKSSFTWRRPDIHLLWTDRFAGTLSGGARGLPLVRGDRPSIAFVLPIVEFGGVEKVAVQVAREFKRAGWHVAVVLFGRQTMRMPLEHLQFADDVIILGPLEYHDWSGQIRYMGEVIPRADGEIAKLLSVLQYFDCVVNCHSWSLNVAMSRLRALGVTTCAYLHLIDESPYGRHVGHVNVSLAFEYTYRFLIACSHTLSRELEALGVPSSKVITVQNAPGYRTEDLAPELQTPAEPRHFEDGRRPRLLYLGRLDRQKGLPRLTALHASTKSFCDWRIVGGAVIAEGGGFAVDLGVEPPVYDNNEIERLYRWADFFILLSDFEGLPLAMLEAMRAGAVPIVTDVGANREVINHGENGFLVSRENAVAETLAILRDVSKDARRVEAMSSKNIATAPERTWRQQAEGLVATMNNIVSGEYAATPATWPTVGQPRSPIQPGVRMLP